MHPKIDIMATNRTFTMLKPDAIENGHMGKIIDMIINAGFQIKAMKYTSLSVAQAQEFYAVHSERPFYGELVDYMTSGPIIAAILEKENAVIDFRKDLKIFLPPNVSKFSRTTLVITCVSLSFSPLFL